MEGLVSEKITNHYMNILTMGKKKREQKLARKNKPQETRTIIMYKEL
jgi:hypothetical protein